MGEGRLRRAAFGALTEAVNEQAEPEVPPVTLFLRFNGDEALIRAPEEWNATEENLGFPLNRYRPRRAAEWQPEPSGERRL